MCVCVCVCVCVCERERERERERESKHLNKGIHPWHDLSGLQKALRDIDALPS
jgi:hypothetical protein